MTSAGLHFHASVSKNSCGRGVRGEHLILIFADLFVELPTHLDENI